MKHRNQPPHPWFKGPIDPMEEYRIKHMNSKFYTLTNERPFGWKEDGSVLIPPRMDSDEYMQWAGVDPRPEPTIDDIIDVKGYNSTNVAIMTRASQRINETTKALQILNDITRPVDLVRLMLTAPAVFKKPKFRETLMNAIQAELDDDIAIVNKVQELLNAEEEEEGGEETTTPEDGTTETSTDVDDDI